MEQNNLLILATPFLPLFDRPNGIGEGNCFLRKVVMVMQNGYSLLTGVESSVSCKLMMMIMMMMKMIFQIVWHNQLPSFI